LCYAAALLHKRDNIIIIDAPATGLNAQGALDRLIQFRPYLVVIDCGFSSLRNDISFAASVKKALPDSVVVVVGPPVAQYPSLILSSGADCAALYEYDYTLYELSQALESNRPIQTVRGVYYKEDGCLKYSGSRDIRAQSLDEIPFVTSIYSNYLDIRDYALGHSLYPMVQIFTGRGCPHSCSFCSWPENFTGRTVRYRSVGNVVEEFSNIQENLPYVKEVFIEDDTFTLSKKRVMDFSEMMIRERIDIPWSCNARADLDVVTMSKMKKAGCRLLDVGFESGNPGILKEARKGIDTQTMIDFAQNARATGLMLLGDFVLGLSGETPETIHETRAFISRLKPHILQVSVATPIPGTLYHEQMKSQGCLVTDDINMSLDANGYQRAIISLPGLPPEELERKVDELLKWYYFNPSYMLRVSEMVLRRGGLLEAVNIIKSARLFLGYSRR
jgi:radical SAM superfamily enzyme YgiQ (UPF0313 family)